MKWKPAFFALLLVTLLGLMAGAPLMAQTQGLLPPSFGSWTAPAPSTQVSAGQIAQFAGDKAAILHEYGVSGGERRDYAQGGVSVTATLYRMTDPDRRFWSFHVPAHPWHGCSRPGKSSGLCRRIRRSGTFRRRQPGRGAFPRREFIAPGDARRNTGAEIFVFKGAL